MSKILAVDPQFRFCGWCLLDGQDVQAGTENYSLKKDLPPARQVMAAYRASCLSPIYPGCRIGVAAIELPDWIPPNARNKQVADLCKVAAAAGALACGMIEYGIPDVRLVQPREWKGRKSKEATLLEVSAFVGETPAKVRKRWDQHAIDAICLALWVQRTAK